jgi:hypothetical protein
MAIHVVMVTLMDIIIMVAIIMAKKAILISRKGIISKNSPTGYTLFNFKIVIIFIFRFAL